MDESSVRLQKCNPLLMAVAADIAGNSEPGVRLRRLLKI